MSGMFTLPLVQVWNRARGLRFMAIHVTHGSGNVFADLGLPYADLLLVCSAMLCGYGRRTVTVKHGDLMRTFAEFLDTLPEGERDNMHPSRMRDILIEALYTRATEQEKDAILEAALAIFGSSASDTSA